MPKYISDNDENHSGELKLDTHLDILSDKLLGSKIHEVTVHSRYFNFVNLCIS